MGATNSTQKETVLRTATKGALTGVQYIDATTGKGVYTRYTKIPYALPPTGSRRWQRPEALPAEFTFDATDGQPGNYTQFGPTCPQPVYNHGSVALPNPNAAPEIPNVQDEDCLYLNIWVPAQDPPAEGWPVQFFIHGGWLQVGDANQSNSYDPYDLLKESPRIIVSPTYRLNLLGFLCGEALSAESSHPPGNYGFWDQRMALEWTSANIELFGGNKNNITVGGLSAGANSTIFQLHYDTRRPEPSDRLIKRIFLYSNAVGIQPNSVTSPSTQAQFEELTHACGISSSLSSTAKLNALRSLPSQKLISAIQTLKHHTFRAGTDDDFISTSFLSSITSGALGQTLQQRGISIMLGEVANEELLYRLVNPATSREDLILQLDNYYPHAVTMALLNIYPLPPAEAPPTAWGEVGARIIADCQVHATIRGFTSSLCTTPQTPATSAPSTTISSPSPSTRLSTPKIYRYHIGWRARSLDTWISPSAKLCHGADVPLWWQSGRRAGFTEVDIQTSQEFLKPFEDFLWGRDVQWGTGGGVREIRELGADGQVRIVAQDEFWDRGMQIWKVMVGAQGLG